MHASKTLKPFARHSQRCSRDQFRAPAISGVFSRLFVFSLQDTFNSETGLFLRTVVNYTWLNKESLFVLIWISFQDKVVVFPPVFNRHVHKGSTKAKSLSNRQRVNKSQPPGKYHPIYYLFKHCWVLSLSDFIAKVRRAVGWNKRGSYRTISSKPNVALFSLKALLVKSYSVFVDSPKRDKRVLWVSRSCIKLSHARALVIKHIYAEILC